MPWEGERSGWMTGPRGSSAFGNSSTCFSLYKLAPRANFLLCKSILNHWQTCSLSKLSMLINSKVQPLLPMGRIYCCRAEDLVTNMCSPHGMAAYASCNSILWTQQHLTFDIVAERKTIFTASGPKRKKNWSPHQQHLFHSPACNLTHRNTSCNFL